MLDPHILTDFFQNQIDGAVQVQPVELEQLYVWWCVWYNQNLLSVGLIVSKEYMEIDAINS